MHTKRFSENTRNLFAVRAMLGCSLVVGACAGETFSDEAAASGAHDVSVEMQALLDEFPEATQVDDRTISWDDGKVMLVLPEDPSAAPPPDSETAEAAPVAVLSQALTGSAAHNCPSGWYCVYEHASWGGRRLQFSDCSRNDLANYGFRDKTTSWVNNGSRRIQVMNDLTARPDEVLWTMSAQSTSSNVGSGANDKADYFRCP
jgi:hypothetical protein